VIYLIPFGQRAGVLEDKTEPSRGKTCPKSARTRLQAFQAERIEL